MTFRYSVGLQNVGSYQVSGRPWLKYETVTNGTEEQISFPFVTKSIKIIKKPHGSSDNLKIGFSSSTSPPVITQTRAINLNSGSGAFEKYTSGTFNYTNTHTISVWINFSEIGDANERLRILECGNGSPNSYQIQAWSTTTTSINFRLQLRDAGGANPQNFDFTTNVSNVNTWHHIAIVRDGIDTHRIYVNGALELEVLPSDIPPQPPSIQNIVIGGIAAGYLGSYDEMTLWSAALNASQILEIYNSGNYYDPTGHSLPNKLESWWAFEDNANGSIYTTPDTTSSIIDRVSQNNLTLDDADGIVDSVFEDAKQGWSLTASTFSLNNFFTLSSDLLEIELKVKCKEIFVYADGHDCEFSICASLTNIPASRMYELTGPGIDE